VAGRSTFILTMWYVNEREKAREKAIEYAFILTMWYVNYTNCKQSS